MTTATDAARIGLEHWQFERGYDDTEPMLELILKFRADLRELEDEIKHSRRALMDAPTEETVDPCPDCGSPLQAKMSGVQCGICGYEFCY